MGSCCQLGQLDEAAALGQRAIALEPLRAGILQSLSLHLTPLGRYDEAEAAVRKAIELQPQAATIYKQLAIVQILRGQSERRWNPRKRKPIRPGAPTHWR